MVPFDETLESFIADYIDGRLSSAESRALTELMDRDGAVRRYVHRVRAGRSVIRLHAEALRARVGRTRLTAVPS